MSDVDSLYLIPRLAFISTHTHAHRDLRANVSTRARPKDLARFFLWWVRVRVVVSIQSTGLKGKIKTKLWPRCVRSFAALCASFFCLSPSSAGAICVFFVPAEGFPTAGLGFSARSLSAFACVTASVHTICPGSASRPDRTLWPVRARSSRPTLTNSVQCKRYARSGKNKNRHSGKKRVRRFIANAKFVFASAPELSQRWRRRQRRRQRRRMPCRNGPAFDWFRYARTRVAVCWRTAPARPARMCAYSMQTCEQACVCVRACRQPGSSSLVVPADFPRALLRPVRTVSRPLTHRARARECIPMLQRARGLFVDLCA